MHVAALVETEDHVCCRYRLRAFQPLLHLAGQELSLHSLPRGLWHRLGIGQGVREADAVVLQRKLLSAMEIRLLRRRVQRLLFDMDDAVWLRDSFSSKGFDSPKRLRRFRATVARCDAIVAGNSFLAEHAERFGGRNVAIIPTCIDTTRYALASHAAPQAKLVWIGSSSTLQGLESISPILEAIGVALPEVTLKIICDRFPRFRDLRTVACPWSEATETSELAGADIGISWIPDDPWSRGKCGLKVLQYMAAGLPVVANPVGVQVEMIRHGETGLLASTPAEWMDAICTLATDPDRRRSMGRAARQMVDEKYSIQAGAAHWLNLLRGLERQSTSA